MILDLAPIHLSEDNESVRIWLHHLVQDDLKFFSPHPGQNDDFLDIGLVHPFYNLGWWDVGGVNSCSVIDVIVHIYDVELCARYRMHGRVQHRLWIPVL